MSNDIFPSRNLPADAEPWGRAVEDRITALETAAASLSGNARGINRTIASSSETLALRIKQLNELYAAIPKPDQDVRVVTNFNLLGGWNDVTSITLNNPGASLARITATASVQCNSPTTSGNIELRGRLVCDGVASPELDGFWFNSSGTWINIVSPSFAWEVDLSSPSVTVGLQLNPVDEESWPTGTGSVAALAVTAMFTG